MAVMANADALVLGDIQVSSALGQPLSAKIAFVESADVDAALKIHLASAEEYQRFGLQYPDSAKINFQVVNEQGTLLPFIRISSPHPIDDPFVNLLLEVVSPSGKLIKAYTFLLDPPSVSSDSAPSGGEIAPGEVHKPSAKDDQSARPVKPSTWRKKNRQKGERTVQAPEGRSYFKLAMSLSISSYDPSLATGPNRDALQEELISKEKALQDLNQQIGEMQAVIKSLQDKRGGVTAVEAPQKNPVAKVVPAAQSESLPAAKSENTGLNSALGFVVALLGVSGFLLYRKYKQMHEWQSGPFDDLHEEAVTEEQVADENKSLSEIVLPVELRSEVAEERGMVTANEAPFTSEPESDTPSSGPAPEEFPALQFEKVTFGDRSMQMPAYAEPIVPPEYTLLMEANRYLRAGDDDKAEQVLQQAIALNPKNLHGYQALLRIYQKRGDAISFENMALKFKDVADEDAFEDVAEMGSKLDPENPLYLQSRPAQSAG